MEHLLEYDLLEEEYGKRFCRVCLRWVTDKEGCEYPEDAPCHACNERGDHV